METIQQYDLAVIGGGINGVGIAADAASRGLRVYLCEQADLACATSSASSKLIHGGLRYLEHLDFRLVKESLKERANLLFRAKHLVKPLEFIFPHHPGIRSFYLIRLGLYLYDAMAGGTALPKSKKIQLKNHLAGSPLKNNYLRGFSYFDCRTDDARLVIANAQKAHSFGAVIQTNTPCIAAIRHQEDWEVFLQHGTASGEKKIRAKILINATGPWVASLSAQLGVTTQNSITLVKGSHIILPKWYEGDFAYILQTDDKRVVFVIPYLNNLALVGTTDVPFTGDPSQVEISHSEKIYLLNTLQHYFKHPFRPQDIIHSFSGVRSLLKDKSDLTHPSRITRDYTFEVDTHKAILITLFGGKITTYRSFAEKVVNSLKPYFPNMEPYDEKKLILPGSEYSSDPELIAILTKRYHWLPTDLMTRYTHQFGSRVEALLSNCHNISDLGIHFGNQLYQKEVDYLLVHEWACSAADILWRRTKLGYSFPKEKITALEKYITDFCLSHRAQN